jgi:type II secretion system protein G
VDAHAAGEAVEGRLASGGHAAMRNDTSQSKRIRRTEVYTSAMFEHSGFTLIELAIVVMIIGILAAIIIPNYMRFADRAKEALVRENVHVIQTGVESYSVQRLGTYPQQADEADLLLNMPNGSYPRNPYTNDVTTVLWNADPATPGEISITNLPGGGYMLLGFGSDGLLAPPIVVGD